MLWMDEIRIKNSCKITIVKFKVLSAQYCLQLVPSSLTSLIGIVSCAISFITDTCK